MNILPRPPQQGPGLKNYHPAFLTENGFIFGWMYRALPFAKVAGENLVLWKGRSYTVLSKLQRKLEKTGAFFDIVDATECGDLLVQSCEYNK